MDAALGRKPYIGMYVIGIVLAVAFALIFVFVGLGFIVDRADVSLSLVVGILIGLLILGIPAAGLSASPCTAEHYDGASDSTSNTAEGLASQHHAGGSGLN
jgi:predicted tellurium resistance membrane protein TerC